MGEVARCQRAAWNNAHEEPSLRIAQRLSISIHAENARAALRRSPPPEEAAVGVAGWGDVCESREDYPSEAKGEWGGLSCRFGLLLVGWCARGVRTLGMGVLRVRSQG